MATEAPKYRLHQTCYIDNTLYAAGSVDGQINAEGEEKPVYYTDTEIRHVPGPHWEPMNEAAKAICKQHSIKFTGFVPDSVDKFARELEATLKERAEREANNGNPDKMAAAMVSALIEAGVIPRPKAKPTAPRSDEPAEI